MKKSNVFGKMWMQGMIAVCAVLLGAATTQAAQVGLNVAVGNASVQANTKQTAYVRVELEGFEYKDDSERPPVNLALVLDKSGSMQGEKLAKAKEAAIMVLDRLRPDDILSVVAYDSRVTVLVPATRVSDRETIRAAIRSLAAGSNTALFAGVSKGAAEVRKFIREEYVNRVILLSDGLANEGPSSPGDLAELGASLIKESISVTTIGLGLDYNEDLMAALARKSDGNHMFAERAQDLTTAFEREFGDLMSVVAKNVDITISCEPGVRPVRALGREVSISGQKVYAGLNQLYGGQDKYVLLEVELDAAAVGSRMPVAQVDISYINMATDSLDALQKSVSVMATDSETRIAADENRSVMEAVAYQVSVERNELAMRLRDEGKIEEGKKVLQENLEYMKEKELKDEDWIYSNTLQMENMERDDSEWRKYRKGMVKGQYEIKQQMMKQ